MDSCQDFIKPVFVSYRLKYLTNERGLLSIRLDRKYRLTFYAKEDPHKHKPFIEIKGIDLKEVSNHYGD